MQKLARLVFLASKLGNECLRMPRDLRRYVENWELYEEVAKQGVEGAAVSLKVPRAQMKKLYDEGRDGGRASLQEFRLLVAEEIEQDERLVDMPTQKRLQIMGALERYVSNAADHIIESDEASLNTKKIYNEIPKWNTGFAPLDLATVDGVYQGLLMLMAKPGQGKTSTMLSMMEHIKRTHPDWQMIFFEQEIPLNMMLARTAPIRKRAKFDDNDLMICGAMSIEEIMKRLEKPPVTKDRVVFIDSPDAMPGLQSDSRRIELGHIYRQLVRIKESSQLVVVASQARRIDSELTLSSPAESWEKVWYVDMMFSVNKVSDRRMTIKNLKNRFGVEGNAVTYLYDLQDLTYDEALIENEEDGWQ